MDKKIVGILFSVLVLIISGDGVSAEEMNGSLASVINISQPAPNRYGAGQPQKESFEAFAGAGVRHVINLRPPSEALDFNEAAAVTRAGMAYYNIPIASAEDLTRENVVLIDSLLTRIGDESTLIHCASSNRVGAIMALRSAWIDGASPQEAIETGKRWGLTGLEPNVAELLGK